MQAHAAVFRTGESLKEGVKRIADCFNGQEDLKVKKNYLNLLVSKILVIVFLLKIKYVFT